jgi:hypothetical protein
MKVGGNAIIGAVMLTIFAGMLAMAAQYPDEAGFMPILVGLPGAALCVVQLCQAVAADRREVLTGSEPAAPVPLRREMSLLGWFAGFIAGIVALGFLFGGPALVFAFLVIDQREKFTRAAALAVGCLAVLYLVFEVLLELTLFRGLAIPLLFG